MIRFKAWHWLVLGWSWFWIQACHQENRLVVFDLVDHSGELPPQALEPIGEYMLGRMGESGSFAIVPRDQSRGQCPTSGTECLRDFTESVGAQFYVTAQIVKPASMCGLVVSLHDRDQDAIVRSASRLTSCYADDVLEAIDQIALRMFSPADNAGVQESVAQESAGTNRDALEKICQGVLHKEDREAEPSISMNLEPVPLVTPPPPPKSGDERRSKKDPENIANFGMVSIDSNPWSEVTVDGRYVGYTPIVDLRLKAGLHQLLLEASGGRQKTVQLEILTDERKKFFVDFPDYSSPVEPRLEGQETTGLISINTFPWSTVYIDGKSIGVTPISEYELPIGQHSIDLENQHGERINRTVVIEGGKKSRLQVKFETDN